MKIKFFAYCAVFFMTVGSAAAQDYAFKVLGSRGHNVVVGGASIKVGAKLTSNQTIEVGEGSYLGLAHNSGKTLELTKKGTYKVQDLTAQINSSGSFTSNYTKFVVDELTEAGSDGIAAKNRFQHMNKTGSVKRDVGSVVPMLEAKQKIFGNILTLRWYIKEGGIPKEAIDRYKVQLFNLSDDLLFVQEVKEDFAVIDLTKDKLAGENIIICKVTPLDKNGQELEKTHTIDGVALTRLDNNESKQISVELSTISKETQGALGKLIQARFFEDKELYADAIHAYEEAIKLSGGTEQFKKIYQFFLERNGFTLESAAEKN